MSPKQEPALLAVATELFYRNGYAGTSMLEVADGMGILKGSLYHYIDSKEDLLERIFARAIRESFELLSEAERQPTSTIERVRTFVESWSAWYMANPAMVTVYLSEWRQLRGERLRQATGFRREAVLRVEALIEAAKRDGSAAAGVDSRYASLFILSAINGIPGWFRPDGSDSAATVAVVQGELVVSMLQGTRRTQAPRRVAATAHPARCGEPKSQGDREAAVLRAAIEVFHRRGYRAATTRDIATASSLQRGSLYHYMESKEGLLAAILEEATAQSLDLLARVEDERLEPADRLREFVRSWCSYYLENIEVIGVYVNEWRHLEGDRLATARETRRRVHAAVSELIAATADAPGAPETRRVHYGSLFLLSALNRLPGWYRRDLDDRPDDIADAYADLASGAVGMGEVGLEVTLRRSRDAVR